MEQATRFDPRIGPFMQSIKSMSTPQTVYYDKAANVRAERIEGVVHLYRLADIIAINRHPAVTGTGGRGGSFGNDAALIPLEIDGADHRKWRRLLDPMFAPKQVARLEDSVRRLAADLIDNFASDRHADLDRRSRSAQVAASSRSDVRPETGCPSGGFSPPAGCRPDRQLRVGRPCGP